MKHINNFDQFISLLTEHFNSYGCAGDNATRESVLSLIPQLGQFTLIEVSTVVVYSSSDNHCYATILYHLPLLDAKFSISTKYMGALSLLRMLSSSLSFFGAKISFEYV